MSLTPQHLMVPIDPVAGFGFQQELAHKACAVAQKMGARLTFFAAVPVLMPAVEGFPPASLPGGGPSLQQAAAAAAKDVLDGIVSHVSKQGVPCDAVVDPACASIPQAVANAAKRTHADLVVMQTHGRKGLNRLLFGSVAERVARAVDCEVLLLKQQSSSVETSTP